jgi:hypothetical protein
MRTGQNFSNSTDLKNISNICITKQNYYKNIFFDLSNDTSYAL